MERAFMAVMPTQSDTRTARLRLEAFHPAHADLVLSWVRDERDAYWFAPKTPPPLTADHIRRWKRPGHEPLQLVDGGRATPIAYGELNVLNAHHGNYWLGHLIVDPQRRRCGIGRALTELLLRRAFCRYAARRVCLVVFPENRAAVACYRAAGMCEDGYEEHALGAYGHRVALLRMAATRFA